MKNKFKWNNGKDANKTNRKDARIQKKWKLEMNLQSTGSVQQLVQNEETQKEKKWKQI